MDEKEATQPVVSLAPAKKRGKKKTEEEFRADLEAKIAETARKAQEIFNRRQKAKSTRKEKASKNRNTVRREIINAVRQAADNADLVFTNANIKVPSKGAKKEKIADYFKKSKMAYYKRTGVPTSLRRQAEKVALAEGLNLKYVNVKTRHKTVSNVLERARKLAEKNRGRNTRKGLRSRAIAMLLASDLGYADEKAAMRSICVREKKK